MTAPITKRARLDQQHHDQGATSQETTRYDTSTISQHAQLIPSPGVAVAGKINCLTAIYFHPVRTEEDLFHPIVCFSPLFVHHFFGLKEEIHGFSELAIRIFYTVDTFEVYVKVEAVRTGTTTPSGGITSSNVDTGSTESDQSSILNEPEDFVQSRLLSYLTKIPYPGDFHRTETSFLQKVNSSERLEFRPYGKSVAHLHHIGGMDRIELFECRFDETTKGGQEFQNYHRRVEWFLHFFIDACSNIDHDNKWTVLLPYVCPERKDSSDTTEATPSTSKSFSRQSSGGGIHTGNRSLANSKAGSFKSKAKFTTLSQSFWSGYELIGVVTLYHFFALPLCRRRVSQFFVFPHFQGRNIGLQLLGWVFQQAINDSDVGEISVEDPAMSFGQLRDIVGLKIALKKGIIKPEDFFPDGTIIEDCESSRSRKTRSQQISYKKENPKISNSSSVGFIGDTEFKKRLKSAIKESPRQMIRLIEIISIAKVFSHPLPPPPPLLSLNNTISAPSTILTTTSDISKSCNKEISRDWRHMDSKLEQIQTSSVAQLSSNDADNDFHHSQAMKDLRIKVKKRIRMDHIEEIGTLSAADQRSNLNNSWNDVYLSYYRTVRKIRNLILQHQF